MRQSILAVAAVGALQLAGPLPAGAQSPSYEQLMERLRGIPLPPGSSRSFTSKERHPPPGPPAAASVETSTQTGVEHPSADVEVYFTPASSRITKQAEPELIKIGRVLSHQDFATSRFRIAGHTDGIGGATYNLELSRRRAQAVRQYLISRFRIQPDRIEAVGFGKEQLKVPEDVASPRNRRVEIVNLSAIR